VVRAPKVYEANADMLVTPLPQGDDALFGLGLVSQSGDPTRDVETLSQLVTTPAVAARVRARLKLGRSTQSLVHDVSATPVAESSIVTITAKEHDPRLAANIANAFGQAAIDARTTRLHTLLDKVIPRLRRQLLHLPPAQVATRDTTAARLQDLETLRALPDPTLHLETRAVAPRSAVAPRPILSIAAAFLAALVLGVLAILGAQILDPRVRREEDLRRYRIPILGRIPLQRRGGLQGRQGPLAPDQLTPVTLEAFRRLATSLASRIDSSHSHSIFVTGAAASDGKTTTSMNLAAALAGLNQRVILVEAESKRPSLARALGLNAARGMTSVVTDGVPLEQALEPTGGMPTGVRVLSQEPGSASAPAQIPQNVADQLVREAESQADWLVIDGPALNYVPEALSIAKQVASVILVVRLGSTRASDLAELAELLTQQDITPDGFIIVGYRRSPYEY
jgi:Mrp family chromosome partitioning ATPase/capsular polysaccharide biosynthesis protein